MNIDYVKEYHDILEEANTLHQQVKFLGKGRTLADQRQRLLDRAEVCETQCKVADMYIQRLPEPKRSIIYLSFCKGMKPADVAAELNMESRQVQRLKLAALDMLAIM